MFYERFLVKVSLRENLILKYTFLAISSFTTRCIKKVIEYWRNLQKSFSRKDRLLAIDCQHLSEV